MHWIRAQLAVCRQISGLTLLASILQVFGGMWVGIEVVSFFSPSLTEGIRGMGWLLWAVGVTIGVIRGWPCRWVRSRLADTDVWVEIRVCDLFALSGAMVVGSNTTFDTSIEDGTIEESSVQGQFTLRYADSISTLDRKIERSLEGVAHELLTDGKQYGKQSEYPMGTVAVARFPERCGYMVAIASLNADRVAATSREDVLGALPRLWEFIREKGSLEALCCPVLGSGFSRLNVPREELIREIVKSFVAAARDAKFSEQLTVAISPEDYRRGEIDLEALGRFLEHECTYMSGRGEVVTSERGVAISR